MRPTREELEAMIYAAQIGGLWADPDDPVVEQKSVVEIAVCNAQFLLDFWAKRDAQEADHG